MLKTLPFTYNERFAAWVHSTPPSRTAGACIGHQSATQVQGLAERCQQRELYYLFVGNRKKANCVNWLKLTSNK